MATINKTYMNLYENKNDDADVTFLVHGQEVKAHKCIISDRSDMLKAMIISDLAPSDGRHRIDDEQIKIEDFKQFLKFLYLDECNIDYTNLAALLHMGEAYFVPLLKEKCMEFVRNQCKNVEGIIQCCEIGILYEDECREMLDFCIKELARKDFDRYEISVGVMEQFAKQCPRTDDLTEEKLFLKIFEWGKAECGRRNIPAETEGIKIVLSPFIEHINLESVSIHSWLQIIKPNELAPLEECYKVVEAFAKSCTPFALNTTPQMLKNGQLPLIERHPNPPPTPIPLSETIIGCFGRGSSGGRPYRSSNIRGDYGRETPDLSSFGGGRGRGHDNGYSNFTSFRGGRGRGQIDYSYGFGNQNSRGSRGGRR